MTINIALATADCIVLGCDSLSSIIQSAIFPYMHGAEPACDKDGMPLLDEDGNMLIPLRFDTMRPVATHVFSGVNKMFCIYEDESKDTVVGAVTSGLAILEGSTIAELAKRFRRQTVESRAEYRTVEQVARAFTDFIGEIWARDQKDIPQNYRATVQFLIAGYGKDDPHGKIYRSDTMANQLAEQFDEAPHSGLCWAGQADYVERLIQAVDSQLRSAVGRELSKAMTAQRELTIADLSKALIDKNINLPEDLEIQVTEHQPTTLPWQQFRADIDYANLSTQYAIHLVEMLVNTQSGMQRFARGIPTVGDVPTSASSSREKDCSCSTLRLWSTSTRGTAMNNDLYFNAGRATFRDGEVRSPKASERAGAASTKPPSTPPVKTKIYSVVVKQGTLKIASAPRKVR
ncbi:MULTISPECIES: hypothetical protein [unclassified Rhodanobacter]|uniref:hypothetical protein n=1 Tax=unclassified Rhodanobacter TaxID=2621553 RepID=UPI000AE99369|nr:MULTISPECIES: hypothetical protein [unclassified Rhodanobacter]